MSCYKSWKSEERFFDYCPMCGGIFPASKMVLLKKSDTYRMKNLTRLCEGCYIKLLDYLGVKDVEL